MVLGIGRVKPNPIDTVTVPGYVGAMGLVGCPGIRVMANSPATRKNLTADIQELVDWGANGVVCLLEPHELVMNKLEDLPERVKSNGMWWRQLPIIDMDIPNQEFEDNWAEEGELIRHALRIGERVVFHCYAGLGRTGMMAARILVEMGMHPEDAIKRIRQDNKRRIQTKVQEELVRTCEPLYVGK